MIDTITAKIDNKKYLREFFNGQNLFWTLAQRDIKVRYRQAVFGLLWAVIRPVLNMIVFVLIFSKMAGFSSGNISYPIFVLLPMIFWVLFSSSLLDCSNSLVQNSYMITKIHFPRMVLPCSSIVIHLVDFSVGLVCFIALAALTASIYWYGLLFIPLFTILCLTLCVGCGLWLAALTARYRDFKFVVPFTIQFGLFMSPVGYSSEIIPDSVQWLYIMNPLVGIIEGIRWSVFGSSYVYLWEAITTSTVITIIILFSGYFYFRNSEYVLADII